MARAARKPRKPSLLLRALRRLPARLRLPARFRFHLRPRSGPDRGPAHRLPAPAVDGHAADDAGPHTAFVRRWRSALGLAAVTLVGGWLGLLALGTLHAPVGPMDTSMALRPSASGGTEVNVSPLGALELRSHYAPLRLHVDVDQLDQRRASALVHHPERFSGLEGGIARDVRSGVTELTVVSAAAVLGGASALGLAVYRRPGRALGAGGLALALLAATGTSAYATWNPKSVLEPRFSGLLASAPSVVGNARSIVTEFDVYQKELARLVGNVTKLYETTSTLPAYRPDPSTLRVLHVSDIHLNPAAWKIVKSLVAQYDIDVIVDSGDTMDHGTPAENGFLKASRKLGAPYVWVRGNHDSDATQRAFEELAHTKGSRVHVLDGGAPVTVAGLRIAGWGDPQFTPDRSVVPAGDREERRDGRRLARALRSQKAAHTPVDVAVAHNPVLAEQTDGRVPLVLAGHTHQRSNDTLKHGTRLMIEGSTGGGGLRAVEGHEPQKVAASVLYLDRSRHRLQAWDEITLGGLGLSTAEVTRHLAEDQKPEAPPSPGISPTPSSSVSPSPSGGASGVPSPSVPSGSPGSYGAPG